MTKKLLDLIETDFCSHKTKHRFTRKDIERLKSCKENLQKCMMPCHATINNAFLTCFYYSDNKIISSSKFWQQIVRLDEFWQRAQVNVVRWNFCNVRQLLGVSHNHMYQRPKTYKISRGPRTSTKMCQRIPRLKR